jgi:hypothetical protein
MSKVIKQKEYKKPAEQKDSLYHTLNKKIPNKPLSIKQKTELITRMKNIASSKNQDTINAIIMLIAEHARYVDGFDFTELPYELQQNGKDLVLDIESLPVELCWILYKFMLVSRQVTN